MPEPHRHRHHSHSRRTKRKLKPVDILLLLWSSISLLFFVILLDRADTAPLWQIEALGASTILGIILFFVLKK